jgi:hypothetical protein
MKSLYTIASFQVGHRVQLHPATDRWMQGDRYGEVVKVGRRILRVRLDKSGVTAKLRPQDIGEIL